MKADIEAVALAGYDVALGTSTWSTFLEVAQRQFNGRGATLLEQTADGRAAAIHAASGLEPSTLREYETYYRGRNVFLLHREHLWTPGNVRTEETGVTPSRTDAERVDDNDFMRPHDLRRAMSTTALRSTGRAAVHLTVFRGHRSPEWDSETMRHLKSALAALTSCGSAVPAGRGVDRSRRRARERWWSGSNREERHCWTAACRPRYVNQALRAMTSPARWSQPRRGRPWSRSRPRTASVPHARGRRRIWWERWNNARLAALEQATVPGAHRAFHGECVLRQGVRASGLVTVGDPSAASGPDPSPTLRDLFEITVRSPWPFARLRPQPGRGGVKAGDYGADRRDASQADPAEDGNPVRVSWSASSRDRDRPLRSLADITPQRMPPGLPRSP